MARATCVISCFCAKLYVYTTVILHSLARLFKKTVCIVIFTHILIISRSFTTFKSRCVSSSETRNVEFASGVHLSPQPCKLLTSCVNVTLVKFRTFEIIVERLCSCKHS